MGGLSPSDLINVSVNLAPTAVPQANFGIPLFIDSVQGVVSVAERMRLYSSTTQVLNDWPNTSGIYLASVAFFGQTPQPQQMYAGVWAQTATPGWLHGAALTTTQQLLANFTAVTAGSMSGYLNGAPFTLTGLNFASAVNINGVASTLQTALAAVVSNSTVTWNSGYSRFEIMSGTTGAASTIGYFSAPTAWGSITFSGNPANNDTVTVNGTVVTFVTGTAVGSQVQIAGSQAATETALAAFLNASVDANIVKMNYSVVGSVVYCVSKLTGAAGNAYTLAKTSTSLAVSGATLSGGTGTDCSAVFGLTLAAGAPTPVAGIAAESALSCVQTMANVSNAWYQCEFVSATQPSTSDHAAIGAFIESASPSRIYGVTTQDPNCLIANVSTDVGSQLQTLGLTRTYVQYCSTSIVAAASLFGRQASVNFNANQTVINWMWKQEPTIAAEVLTETGAAALKAKNINVFTTYVNGASIIQWGVMSSGLWADTRVGADWLQNLIQTTLWNVLYTTPTKVPQTDQGQQLLITPTKNCCVAAVNNGFAAPGLWTGPNIGQIATGDMLPTGFYVFSDIYANQSPANRAARQSMPIQVAIKLAGAVDTVACIVSINA